MNEFKVNVPAWEQIFIKMGFPHLERKSEDEPIIFVGSEESKKALKFIREVGMPIEVQLNLNEVSMILDLLEKNQDAVKFFGVQGCAEKLEKAIFDEKNKDLLEAVRGLKLNDNQEGK